MTIEHRPEMATDPVTDINRLIDISGYDLESTALRVKLNGLAQLAAERLHMPAGVINIVLDTAQYAAGTYGLDGTWIAEADGTPVEWAFCANVVRTGAAYVVENAELDTLQNDNPLVTDDGVRSYAGVPLFSPAGHILGACCVLDFIPRAFSPANIEQLTSIATDVLIELIAHRHPSFEKAPAGD